MHKNEDPLDFPATMFGLVSSASRSAEIIINDAITSLPDVYFVSYGLAKGKDLDGSTF